MNKIQAEGSARIVSGKTRQTEGLRAANAGLRANGEVNQANGELEAALGAQLQELRKWTVQRPLTALVLTACIAFVFGARWASQWRRNNT